MSVQPEAGDAPLVVALPPREYAVAQYIPTAMSYEEIAAQLFSSKETVRNHLRKTYQRVGVGGRPGRAGNARQQVTCLLSTGQLRFERRTSHPRRRPSLPQRLDFTAFVDPAEDVAFEKRRIQQAFAEYLERRLA